MKFTKTLQITSTKQLFDNPPQRGQWIQLAWCDKPSRFHSVKPASGSVVAFHFPSAVSAFNSYCNPNA